jgi:peroxiredoxin
VKIGDKGPDFVDLMGVCGERHSLADFDQDLLVLIFSCNHCPVVVAYEDRMIQIQADYADKGVKLIAINPNDDVKYPADNFDSMVRRAAEKEFNFPYLRDDTQEVSRAYGAERTPEVFVLDSDRILRYHGRIDDNTNDPASVQSHDLRNALDELLSGEEVKVPDTTPVGCTIKWK